MTTDPLATARALIAAQPNLLFRCDLCPDECNCHPHHDMSMSGEHILCDECEDFDAVATPPNPLKLIATLADALEAERAKVAAAYEAAALVTVDMGPRYDGRSVHYHIPDNMKNVIRDLTPSDAQAALDKLLAEARLEGWRAGRDAAAEIAAASGGVKSAPLNDGCGTMICQPVMGCAVAAHIRALPEPKENSND